MLNLTKWSKQIAHNQKRIEYTLSILMHAENLQISLKLRLHQHNFPLLNTHAFLFNFCHIHFMASGVLIFET